MTTPVGLVCRVSDLRQYAYCPRVVFYRQWMPGAGRPTEAMSRGVVDEARLRALESRRTLRRYGLSDGRRRFRADLYAPFIGLSGTADMVVETARGRFPVEFKDATWLAEGHELQVGAYGLMLEEIHGAPVECGFVYLIAAGDVKRVGLTRRLREAVGSTIGRVRAILSDAVLPEPTSRRARCAGCEYLHFCGDVYEVAEPEERPHGVRTTPRRRPDV